MAQDPLVGWRVAPGTRPALSHRPTTSKAGAPGGKSSTREATATLKLELEELQARLYAEGARSVLLVLQAMDTGGKDGTIRNVLGGVNPQGVVVTSFKRPTDLEHAHDFLWRVHQAAPPAGTIGVFNRSHYEDVLVARVHELVPEAVWRRRYEHIRSFERLLHDNGTRVVKVMLHISRDEQRERLQSRLADPSKHWKFEAGDLAERERWDDYQQAYEDAISETSSDEAPWYVVPADKKWYRDWAISTLLQRTLLQMDPQFPDAEPGLEKLTVPK